MKQALDLPIQNVKHKDFGKNLDVATIMLKQQGKEDFFPNLARAIAEGRLQVDGYDFVLLVYIWCSLLFSMFFLSCTDGVHRVRGTIVLTL